MTEMEIFVIIVCLFGGYWLVGKFLDPAPPPLETSAESDVEPAHEPNRPWHVVLDVSREATRREIADAYKRGMSQYHPDKVATMGEDIRALAEERCKEINAAHAAALKYNGW